MKRTFIAFLTFVFYFSSFTHVYAATPKWVLDYIKVEKQVADKKRLQASLIKQINEAGSLTTKTAVVETVPTASKVGTSMLKRVNAYAKAPGVAYLGVYAVTQLIEGIGWVMEEGTYVKKIPIETDTQPTYCEYAYNHSGGGTPSQEASWGCTIKEAGDNYCVERLKFTTVANCTATVETIDSYRIKSDCKVYNGVCYGKDTVIKPTYKKNPYFDPNSQKPTEKKVPLTPSLLGAAMIGTGYKDPDPNFNNDSVNTGNWTGVPEAYTPDPSDVGNDLYRDLETKADKAPRTSDGKPAPGGDSRYFGDPSTNDTVNDRTWDSRGTTGDSTGTTQTNPDTGEQTTNTEFNLPPFCSWAFTVCEWYEKWQKTDVKVNEHIDRTKEHQEEEKTFWQSVKDWFDWTKESPDDQPDIDQPDIDDQGIFSRTFDTVFSLSKECPPDIPFNLDTEYLKGSYQISLRWLCIIFTSLGYPLLFASNCLGIWILYEAVIRKEIKVN